MSLSKPAGIAILAAVTAAAAAVAFSLQPIAQWESYHAFADGRAFLGVPNFQNVASNLPFLYVGFAGLAALRHVVFVDAGERRAYAVFFAAVAAVAVGSGWYHWAPSTESLYWDRLPMSVAFGGLVAAVFADRLHPKAAATLLWPLVLTCVGTVVWWRVTEQRGHGDLRAYGLAQGLPAVWILLAIALFPGRSTRGGDFLLLLVWYGAAKLLEHFDAAVFSATGGAVSGHALKHLAAAAATWQVVRMVRRRIVSADRPGTVERPT